LVYTEISEEPAVNSREKYEPWSVDYQRAGQGKSLVYTGSDTADLSDCGGVRKAPSRANFETHKAPIQGVGREIEKEFMQLGITAFKTPLSKAQRVSHDLTFVARETGSDPDVPSQEVVTDGDEMTVRNGGDARLLVTYTIGGDAMSQLPREGDKYDGNTEFGHELEFSERSIVDSRLSNLGSNVGEPAH
jgi:hypothetical protein